MVIFLYGCVQTDEKTLSPMKHYIEEYRRMYYNNSDSLFFMAIIEEADDKSSLFLLGNPVEIPKLVMRPIFNGAVEDVCEILNVEGTVDTLYINDKCLNRENKPAKYLGYFSFNDNFVFVYSACNCDRCNSILKGVVLDKSEDLDARFGQYMNCESYIDAKEWLFTYDDGQNLRLELVR